MKSSYILLAIIFTLSCKSNDLHAQCTGNPKHIEWLHKMLRIQFPITNPSNITFTTKPTSIYEAPFAFIAFVSFVKAGNEPYFYLWTSKDHFKESTDFKKGDKIIFYLANGSSIESTCEDDYSGIKGQTISFYKLQKSNLEDLSRTSVDSIFVQSHLRLTEKSDPEKIEDKPIVLRKFSKKNIELMKEWAVCLKDHLK